MRLADGLGAGGGGGGGGGSGGGRGGGEGGAAPRGVGCEEDGGMDGDEDVDAPPREAASPPALQEQMCGEVRLGGEGEW